MMCPRLASVLTWRALYRRRRSREPFGGEVGASGASSWERHTLRCAMRALARCRCGPKAREGGMRTSRSGGQHAVARRRVHGPHIEELLQHNAIRDPPPPRSRVRASGVAVPRRRGGSRTHTRGHAPQRTAAPRAHACAAAARAHALRGVAVGDGSPPLRPARAAAPRRGGLRTTRRQADPQSHTRGLWVAARARCTRR